MNLKLVYAVFVKSELLNSEPRISQECYTTLKDAQDFIEHRSDKPRKITEYHYKSAEREYKIYDLLVNEDKVN